MSTPTVPVTVTLEASDGTAAATPMAGVTVTARLNGNEIYQGVVVARSVTAVTDVNGVAVLHLFPNAAPPAGFGSQGTTYIVTAHPEGGRLVRYEVAVPNSPCRIENIIVSDAPSVDAAQRAVSQAQAGAAAADTSAGAAAASAAVAVAQAGLATTKAANAAGSEDAAAGSAGSATAAADLSVAARDAAVAAKNSTDSLLVNTKLARTPSQRFGVYDPAITRGSVISAASSVHKYAHDSAIEWFVDRWICQWNANTSGNESQAPQYILESESFDFVTWSAPVQPYNDAARSTNPVNFQAGSLQWQPGLGLINNELWSLWHQDGTGSGTYFSRRTSPADKWTNTLLALTPYVRAGVTYASSFVTGDLVQLPSGRVLAPVVMMSDDTAVLPAPLTNNGFFERLKLGGVIYTDNNGASWNVGGMVTMQGTAWGPWEPFLVIQPDGSVRLTMRNLDTTTSSDRQQWTCVSLDEGDSFTAPQPMRADTVSARGTAVNRLQTDAPPVMVLNDNRKTGSTVSLADRRNLAVWVGTGDNDFIPGPGLSSDALDNGPCYPSARIRNGKLYVVYSSYEGAGDASEIKTVVMDPAPAYGQLLPRSNVDKYTSPIFETAPRRQLRFYGSTRINSQGTLAALSGTALSIALLGYISGSQPALFDSRTATADGGCLVKVGANGNIRVGTYNAASANAYAEVDTGVLVPYKQQAYVGVSIDGPTGSITAYAVAQDGTAASATVLTGYALANLNPASTASLGCARVGSTVPCITGTLHLERVYDAVMTASQHRSLQQSRAVGAGMTAWAGAAVAPPAAAIDLDANNVEAGTNSGAWLALFTATGQRSSYVTQVAVGGRQKLKIIGNSSVGVPKPLSITGPVHYTFRYQASAARSVEVAVCTLGSAARRVSLVLATDGTLKARWIGGITNSADLTLGTGIVDSTEYRVHVIVRDGRITIMHEGCSPQTIRFSGRPWMFLGEAWPTGTSTSTDFVLVDVQSVAAKTAAVAEPAIESDGVDHFTPATSADVAYALSLRGEANPRFIQYADGKMAFGTGAAFPDRVIDKRTAAGGLATVGTASTTSWQVGNGTWNGGHLLLGDVQVWRDSTGTIRTKDGSTPVNETDGSPFASYVDSATAAEIIRTIRNGGITRYTQRANGRADWTLATVNDTGFSVGISGEAKQRLVALGEGKMLFGPGGNTDPPVALVYRLVNGTVDTVGTPSTHSFSVGDGTWNGGRLHLGTWGIWRDSWSTLREKTGSAPANETDGAIFGSVVNTTTATELVRDVKLSSVRKFSQRGDGRMDWSLLVASDVAAQVGYAGEANPRGQWLADGKITFGPGGAVAPSVSLAYRLIGALDTVGTPSGTSFSVGNGAWNGGRLLLGANQLWLDSTNQLIRTKLNGASPTSETDGFYLPMIFGRGTFAQMKAVVGMANGDRFWVTNYPAGGAGSTWIYISSVGDWFPENECVIGISTGIIEGAIQTADQMLLAFAVEQKLLTNKTWRLRASMGRSDTADAYNVVSLRMGTAGTIADTQIATASGLITGTSRTNGIDAWQRMAATTKTQKLGGQPTEAWNGSASGTFLNAEFTVPSVDTQTIYIGLSATMAAATTTKPQIGHTILSILPYN